MEQNTFQTKKKENFSQTRKYKNKKKQKKIYLQEHGFCIQEKTDQLFLSFGQYCIANFLLHIVGRLKILPIVVTTLYMRIKKRSRYQSLLRKVKQLTKELNSHKKTCTCKTPIDQRIIKTDKDVLFYTGIKSKVLSDNFFK